MWGGDDDFEDIPAEAKAPEIPPHITEYAVLYESELVSDTGCVCVASGKGLFAVPL